MWDISFLLIYKNGITNFCLAAFQFPKIRKFSADVWNDIILFKKVHNSETNLAQFPFESAR